MKVLSLVLAASLSACLSAQTVIPPIPAGTAPKAAATEKVTVASPSQLKDIIVQMFNDVGSDTLAEYDVLVVTVTHFKQTRNTGIDSTSVKMNSNGISAIKTTNGETTKETIVLRTGKIGNYQKSNMETTGKTVVPFSKKEQIGTPMSSPTTIQSSTDKTGASR